MGMGGTHRLSVLVLHAAMSGEESHLGGGDSPIRDPGGCVPEVAKVQGGLARGPGCCRDITGPYPYVLGKV